MFQIVVKGKVYHYSNLNDLLKVVRQIFEETGIVFGIEKQS